MSRYYHDIIIAIESIISNKLRSLLTGLGIIFGVGAVISMLAIGNGAQKEILDQIKMVGVNNIMISPVLDTEAEETSATETTDKKQNTKFSPGLHLTDVEAITEVLPTLNSISPEIAKNSFVILNGRKASAKLMGVASQYFNIFNLELEKGSSFTDYQEDIGIPVCIIGSNIDSKFFSKKSAINQYIKVDQVWLKVIGVMKRNDIKLTRFENTGVNVMNDNIYIPVKTMLLRFQNRAMVSARMMNSRNFFRRFGGSSASSQNTKRNYHQLDRIIVQVKDSKELSPSTEFLSRMILRRHQDVRDFEITVPELLLKQEQKTKDVFNIVLGAIASISLLVGGIGIMNIMFASVMERIKEIGTRLAIGARKKDIIVQFLSEAVLISVIGGIIGVILGIVGAKVIMQLAGILTIISPFSVIIAFAVSASVGIIFGYSPAKRASEKDPIESLRYE